MHQAVLNEVGATGEGLLATLALVRAFPRVDALVFPEIGLVFDVLPADVTVVEFRVRGNHLGTLPLRLPNGLLPPFPQPGFGRAHPGVHESPGEAEQKGHSAPLSLFHRFLTAKNLFWTGFT